MKSELAKARDEWFESEDGKKCSEGQASGQYLNNRLERAFIAGWDAHKKIPKGNNRQRLSREEVMAHLDRPVCETLMGLRIHLQVIGLLKTWELCYALKRESPEKLLAVMWDMIKKRKRKDSTWQNYLPAQRDGS